jgi:acyl-CoA thioester hydrolase
MDYTYSRPVQYYETDAMGVVHHSNYIRLFEEARVGMMRDRDVLKMHHPYTDRVIAVLETQCRHFKPAYFDDILRVETQVRMLTSRIQFQYRVFTQRFADTPIADGMSLHIMVDSALKVRKPPREMRDLLEREPWTETWRSNL